jgi:prevent-host-death family protein
MIMTVVDIRNNLADAINRVAYAGERIILERRGKGVAALVSLQDVALLEELENQADIRAAKRALKEKGRVPLAKIKTRLGMK